MLNYGIVTNTWNMVGADSETSVAVGHWNNINGTQNGSNDSKSAGSNAQYWMVGSISGKDIQVKGYHVYLRSPDDIFNNHHIYYDKWDINHKAQLKCCL